MAIEWCIPVIPSADLETSKRLWVQGLGFTVTEEMHEGNRLVMCMLQRGPLQFILNRRAGTAAKPAGYEGIRLYWAPSELHALRDRLKGLGFQVSEPRERDYGQTEFVMTDDDGYSHCFGAATATTAS